MKALKNVRIYDFNTYIPNGYIVFDEKIIEVGEMKNYKEEYNEEIDGKGMLLMPTFVNGHSHIYSTFSRGMKVPFNPKSFKEILTQLWWKLDRNLDNEMTYYSGIVSGYHYLRHGVTTIIDHHASGEIKGSLASLDKALSTYHLRRVLCFETSDRFDIKECISENLTNIKTNKGLFGMHASFTLSDESLQEISKVLGNSPIHIHVAESKYDQDHAIETFGKRVIHRLNQFHLLTKNSIITHGLYLSDDELDLIKEKEAVIALNVSSNMNNSVGLPNYQKMKEKGIKVIIGNDGINMQMAKEYISLFFSQHHHDQTPTSFGFDDIIDIINNTYDYASDILGVKLGKVQRGFEADFQLILYDEPTPLNKSNIMGHMMFGLFNDFVPNDVFIKGVQMVKNKTVLADKSEYQKASKVAQKLWNKIEKEGIV